MCTFGAFAVAWLVPSTKHSLVQPGVEAGRSTASLLVPQPTAIAGAGRRAARPNEPPVAGRAAAAGVSKRRWLKNDQERNERTEHAARAHSVASYRLC